MSFGWALLFGGGLGALAYFRPPPAEAPGRDAWYARARGWLETLELASFDWRARALGEQSKRSDEVVLVLVDDETIASARESSNPLVSLRPWPHEVYGMLAEQALKEGAAYVILDVPVTDFSPRQCAPAKGEKKATDDEALRARLEKAPSRCALTFNGSAAAPRQGDQPMRPYLVKVGEFDRAEEASEALRRALAARANAYLIPAGTRFEVWAGVGTEARVKDLAATLELGPSPTVRDQTPADDAFSVSRAQLLARLEGVEVLGAELSALPHLRTVEAPVAALLTSAIGVGALQLSADSDGVVRRFPHLLTVNEAGGRTRAIPSAAVLAAQRLSGEAQGLRIVGGVLEVGSAARTPVDVTGAAILRWDAAETGKGGRGSLKRSLPAWRLWRNLEDDVAGRGVRHDDNELAGRVVILSDPLGASVLTPLGPMPPAAVLGQALVNLQRGQGITRIAPERDLQATVALAFAGALLAVAYSSVVRRSGWVSLLLVLGLAGAAWAVVARQLFVVQQVWLAVAAPSLALSLTFLASLGYAAVLERRLRDFVASAVGRAIPSEVFGRLESNIGLMRPVRRPMAIYVSSLEGFTTASDTQAPAKVVADLQEYLREVTRIIVKQRGQPDKYLGDGVLAFWGAPVRVEDPVVRACEAALTMRQSVLAMHGAWEKDLGQRVVLRAGLDFGDTLVGEMGTEHRLNYSVMGTHVSTAFKLSALARRYGVDVLVGEAVLKEAGDRFLFREVDLLARRGGSPVRVYELVGRNAERAQHEAKLRRYNTAYDALRARRFPQALMEFEALATEFADALCGLHAERCRKAIAAPPPADWDGVWPD